MDVSKVFTVICAFLLVICLTLSITSVVVLRNTVQESEEWQNRAETLVGSIGILLDGTQENGDVSTSLEPDTPDTEVDVLYNRFCLREENGKICVFSEEGYLIRTVEVDPKTLPLAEQKALSDGIYLNSWKELIERIQDYE